MTTAKTGQLTHQHPRRHLEEKDEAEEAKAAASPNTTMMSGSRPESEDQLKRLGHFYIGTILISTPIILMNSGTAPTTISGM